jgi:hypothetical protein
MEYFTRMQKSRLHALLNSKIKLTNKKNGQVQYFTILDYQHMKEYNDHNILKEFDMAKLEVEYDYETDREQEIHSKKMLLKELAEAIDFYILEDPIKLVENVLL